MSTVSDDESKAAAAAFIAERLSRCRQDLFDAATATWVLGCAASDASPEDVQRVLLMRQEGPSEAVRPYLTELVVDAMRQLVARLLDQHREAIRDSSRGEN